MKRQIAYIIVVFVGFLALLGHFINYTPLNDFIDNDATQWFDIISGFAAFLGVVNLLQLHFKKLAYKKKNWRYSIITLSGFTLMIFFGFVYKGLNGDPYVDQNNNGIYDEGEAYTDIIGNNKYDLGEDFIDANNDGEFNYPESFTDMPDNEYTKPVRWGAHLKNKESAFYWMFNNIYLPLGATMFALLAFFVASASYRAFKIRNFEATLLLISGVLLMIGRVPIGQVIPWWMALQIYICILFSVLASKISNKRLLVISIVISLIIFPIIVYSFNITHLKIFSIPNFQEWIFDVPATAGSRAIMIGIALGTIAQSFRIITGRERSILGD